MTSTDWQLKNYEAFGNLPTNQEAMNQLAAKNPLLAPFLEIESQLHPDGIHRCLGGRAERRAERGDPVLAGTGQRQL